MKVWIIRGRYNAAALRAYYKKYPDRDVDHFEDGQLVYWSRRSEWDRKEKASIQTNERSAKAAFTRAKDYMEGMWAKYVIDIELVEAELVIPGGE